MFTVIRKTVIGKTDIGKTVIGKSHTNKEHKNKEHKNKEKREKSNALFENWFIECAYRFDSVLRKNVIWRYRFCGAKRPWLSLWESWLPRMGQTERVPRSNTRFQSSNGVPSQSACSADSSPKGRAKGAAAPVR